MSKIMDRADFAAALQEARNVAFEQAAKVCEEYARSQRRHAPVQVAAGICAHRIRALLEPSDG